MHCRWYPSMPCSRSPVGVCVLSQHALQVVSQHALQQVSGGDLLWGGAWSGGMCVCLWGEVPGPGGRHPSMHWAPWERRLLLRTVCIPLECILVLECIWDSFALRKNWKTNFTTPSLSNSSIMHALSWCPAIPAISLLFTDNVHFCLLSRNKQFSTQTNISPLL